MADYKEICRHLRLISFVTEMTEFKKEMLNNAAEAIEELQSAMAGKDVYIKWASETIRKLKAENKRLREAGGDLFDGLCEEYVVNIRLRNKRRGVSQNKEG